MAIENINFNGMAYERDILDGHEHFRLVTNTWARGVGITKIKNKDNRPEVLCECLNDKFVLRYGNYEIFAKCTKCGVEASVYSG